MENKRAHLDHRIEQDIDGILSFSRKVWDQFLASRSLPDGVGTVVADRPSAWFRTDQIDGFLSQEQPRIGELLQKKDFLRKNEKGLTAVALYLFSPIDVVRGLLEGERS